MFAKAFAPLLRIFGWRKNETTINELSESIMDPELERISDDDEGNFKYGITPSNLENLSGIDGIGTYILDQEDMTKDFLTLSDNALLNIQVAPNLIQEDFTLSELDLSNNAIEADIDVFKSISSLKTLKIEDNKFSGSIDILIENLPNLRILSASDNNLKFSNDIIDLTRTKIQVINLTNNNLNSITSLGLPRHTAIVIFMGNPDFLSKIKEIWIFEELDELSAEAIEDIKKRQDNVEEEMSKLNNADINDLKRQIDAITPSKDIRYTRNPILNTFVIQDTGFTGNIIRCELFDTDEDTYFLYDLYPVPAIKLDQQNILPNTAIKDLDLLDEYGFIRQTGDSDHFVPYLEKVPEERKTCSIYFTANPVG